MQEYTATAACHMMPAPSKKAIISFVVEYIVFAIRCHLPQSLELDKIGGSIGGRQGTRVIMYFLSYHAKYDNIAAYCNKKMWTIIGCYIISQLSDGCFLLGN